MIRASLSAQVIQNCNGIIAHIKKIVKSPTFTTLEEVKMQKFTEKDLYEFVYRADTLQKTAIAERWLSKNRHIMSRSTYDDLILTLSHQSKRIFLAKISEYPSI